MSRKKPFARALPERPYQKVFLIATEGRVTEPEYFGIIRRLYPEIRCLIKQARKSSNNRSSPEEVLRLIQRWMKENGQLSQGDEAWLVVDKDSWTQPQLDKLRVWVSREGEHHFGRRMALSDPKFEYWLLLHFENSNVANSKDCTRKLKRHLALYEKSVNVHSITKDRVEQAIVWARQRDGRGGGASTAVYKLVGNILDCPQS